MSSLAIWTYREIQSRKKVGIRSGRVNLQDSSYNVENINLKCNLHLLAKEELAEEAVLAKQEGASALQCYVSEIITINMLGHIGNISNNNSPGRITSQVSP